MARESLKKAETSVTLLEAAKKVLRQSGIPVLTQHFLRRFEQRDAGLCLL